MRNYIILNGNNSNEITGLLIQSLPPITKPLIRTTIEEIDGRDGDIVTNLGYSAYDKEISIGLYGDYDVDEVIKYFHDNQKGQVVFSNEDDKYYNYEIINQIDFERLIRFKTATVTLHCQPFKYDEDEEQIQVDATQVTGEGTDLTLEYTIQNASLALIPKGDTQQDSTTGKNLFTGIFRQGTNADLYATTRIYCDSNYYIEQGKTYTFSSDLNYSSFKYGINISGTQLPSSPLIYDSGWKTANFTFTANVSGYLGVALAKSDNSNLTPSDVSSYHFQLEENNTATTYEPYTNGASPNPSYPQPIQVVTGRNDINVCGKNLIDTSKVYSYTIYTGSSTVSPTTGRYAYLMKVKPNTKYTFSRNAVGTASLSYLALFDNFIVGQNNIYTSATNVGSNLTQTITTGANTKYVMFLSGSGESTNIQLEQGETASTYEAYTGYTQEINLGSIELCKISTYQDYIYKTNDKWYIHKEIGKVVLDGSEENNKYFRNGQTTNFNQFGFNISGKQYGTLNLKSNKFIITSLANSVYEMRGSNNGDYIVFNLKPTDCEYTISGIKNWISSNNVEVKYVLAEPTETEITNSTLINQLDAIENAYCYQTTTNVITSGDDLPIIVNATTSGMANTIVKNKGNIIAKPLMTIYGSGNIGVYFNEIQVIQIALGDESQITIDVANMEAYNQETLVLKNRLVTGDYNNMVLNTGDNEITFSGNVLGFTMDKYSRWL